ncbi:MAG TPA: hypothetical protein VIL01_11495 [Thermomicrobiales bacterium]
MNPYVSFGLAMCVIVLISLAATAYMAVYFNRRAKADMAAALAPLAEVVGGEADVEEARVSGRFAGHIAEGRVRQTAGGMGRVFQAFVIDGAGGSRWTWTMSRSKDPGGPDSPVFEGASPELQARLEGDLKALAAHPTLAHAWLKVEYDPAPGHILLTRPMRTRRDLPSASAFSDYLKALVAIADGNRAVQHPDG